MTRPIAQPLTLSVAEIQTALDINTYRQAQYARYPAAQAPAMVQQVYRGESLSDSQVAELTLDPCLMWGYLHGLLAAIPVEVQRCYDAPQLRTSEFGLRTSYHTMIQHLLRGLVVLPEGPFLYGFATAHREPRLSSMPFPERYAGKEDHLTWFLQFNCVVADIESAYLYSEQQHPLDRLVAERLEGLSESTSYAYYYAVRAGLAIPEQVMTYVSLALEA